MISSFPRNFEARRHAETHIEQRVRPDSASSFSRHAVKEKRFCFQLQPFVARPRFINMEPKEQARSFAFGNQQQRHQRKTLRAARAPPSLLVRYFFRSPPLAPAPSDDASATKDKGIRREAAALLRWRQKSLLCWTPKQKAKRGVGHQFGPPLSLSPSPSLVLCFQQAKRCARNAARRKENAGFATRPVAVETLVRGSPSIYTRPLRATNSMALVSCSFRV